jgi:polysaccharide biosynthesis protein PslG
MTLRAVRTVRRTVTAVAVALPVALATFLLPGGPASAVAQPVITASYFGSHLQGLSGDGPAAFPQGPVGSLRLWDDGVSWREIETAPGVFDWTVLDAEMAKAREHGVSVLLVLGQTPTFHSTRPAARSTYGPGASAMPTQAAWAAYVRAVATRNRTVWGGIASFQVWNEANVAGYWSGTPKQMATLTAWTRSALRSAGSSATLVAPALVTRLISQRAWSMKFFAQKVAGKSVSAYVDALSFQLYPAANGSPESSMKLLAATKVMLAREGVHKPIWNTEVNYGLSGSSSVPAASTAKQVGNVLRTYVLNAENGVRRVYWYSWDLLGLSNTPLVQSDRVTLTPAGQAFGTARSWLLGTRPAGCSRDRNGTWSCSFLTATQTRRVVWNPSGTRTVPRPSGSPTLTRWNSTGATRVSTAKVSVGIVPLLLTSRR